MQFFLDTANLDELTSAAQWGVVDGVTTNPTLIAREGAGHRERISDICKIIDGPVSAEVVSTVKDEMVAEGRSLASIHKNVVVKLPLTRDGIAATRILSSEGLRVNVTLVFSEGQALLAAKAGAAFVSPFVGRLDDIGHVGMDLVRGIRLMYDNAGFGTAVLAASLRSPLHVIDAAKAGADAATMPFKVLDQLFDHPLTKSGLDRFLADYAKAFGGPKEGR